MKAKTHGTWQCKHCDTTYQQVNRLNGDPTAATAEFYAAAAGKGIQETKRLWEHHANKYKYKAKGFPIQDIFDKSLPQNVQPCSMLGTMDRVPAMFLGKRCTSKEESGKRKTAVAQSKLEDEKPKDGKPGEEKPRKDSSLVFLAQMLLCAVEKVERPEVLIASVVGAARDRHGPREPCSLVQTESLAPREVGDHVQRSQREQL